MGNNRKTPASSQTGTGRNNSSADAMDSRNINDKKSNCQRAFYLSENGKKRRLNLKPSTRPYWALQMLLNSGALGLTTLERPAPRWSAYVHLLRKAGVEIETIREKHGGEFSGTHGRYVLRSIVRRNEPKQ